MSVTPNELRFYGSANMNDTDPGGIQGGAVAFNKKVTFYDITPSGLLDYLSDNAADTGCSITAFMRNAAGTIVSEVKTTNGTTIVNGTTTAERLEKITVAGTAAVGNLAVVAHTKVITAHTCSGSASNASGVNPPLVKLQSGDGASVSPGMIIRFNNNQPAGIQGLIAEIIDSTSYGTDFIAIGANLNSALLPGGSSTYDIYQGMFCGGTGPAGYPNLITEVRRLFYNAAADVSGGSQRTYYEKVFAVNDDTTIDLTTAILTKVSDPAVGTLNFALELALNGTASVANRQSAPPGGIITSYSVGAGPQAINVPNGSQNLPHGAAPNSAGAQGIWFQWVLPAGTAPSKGSFTEKIAGNTT